MNSAHYPDRFLIAKRLFKALWLVTSAFLFVSCVNSPTPLKYEQHSLVDVPIPSSIDTDKLTVKTGEQRTRAGLSLDEVIHQIQRPSYLPDLTKQDTATTTPNTEDIEKSTALDREPPLEAQRSYIRGRVAWLYRDVAGAKRHLKVTRRLIPQSTDLMRILAEIYMRTLEPARGAKLLEQAIKGNPNDGYALYLLGRYTGDQRKWSESIATLAQVLSLPDNHADPALHMVTRYLLGNALAQEGYDAAAIEQLSLFLELPEHFGRTTRMIRELVVLSRERDSTWQSVGDAHHRLGQPALALQSYQSALEHSSVIREALIWRLIYSHLRLGQTEKAQQIVLDDLDRRGADDDSLRMIRYLVSHGADRDALAITLRSHYERGTDTPPVVLALSELLSSDDALFLLKSHITTHPTDQSVLRQLVRIQDQNHRPVSESIQAVAGVIRQTPYLAPEYTAILLELTSSPQNIANATSQAMAVSSNDSVLRYIAGIAYLNAQETNKAITELRQAVLLKPPLTAARIKLAQLLADNGQLDEADRVLLPLANSRRSEVIRLRARIMAKNGRNTAAVSLLDAAIFENPNDLDLTLEKSSLHLSSGDPEAAEQTLLDALDKQPRAERLYEQLISLYQSGRISEPAQPYQELVRRMMRMIPLARVARLERAKVLAAGKRHEQAITVLKQLLSEDPDDPAVLTLMIQSLSATDRSLEATAMLENVLADHPDDQRLLGIALLHYRRVQNREKSISIAYKVITKLIQQRPLPVRTIDGLMQLLDSLEAAADLSPLLDAQIALHPKDKNLLLLARSHYQRLGDQYRVFDTTEELLTLSSPSPLRQIRLAAFYLENGMIDLSIQALEDVFEHEDSATINAAIGLVSQAMLSRGVPDEADRWFTDTIKKYAQHSPQLRFGWAIHCDRRGNSDQAVHLMTQLTHDHPEHAEANNWLGYTWADRGINLEQAKVYIQSALDTDPENAAYLDSMGWVMYKSGHFVQALQYLERAHSKEGGDHPVIVDHLGDAQYRVGKTIQATDTWRTARRSIAEIPNNNSNTELRQLANSLDKKLAAVAANTPPPLAETLNLPDEDDTAADEHGLDAMPKHQHTTEYNISTPQSSTTEPLAPTTNPSDHLQSIELEPAK